MTIEPVAPAVEDPRKAEVHDLDVVPHPRLLHDEDVLRLEIAVHDASDVRGLEPGEDAVGDL